MHGPNLSEVTEPPAALVSLPTASDTQKSGVTETQVTNAGGYKRRHPHATTDHDFDTKLYLTTGFNVTIA